MDLASLTASGRLTRPICLRFIFDGLGNFTNHSGTGDPIAAARSRYLGNYQRVGALSFQRDHLRLQNGASSFVKYVTAFPSLPARPVRPKGELSLNAQLTARHVPIR